MNRVKVAVGLSGGVDSAVSALLLKKVGYDVAGVHLYCWPPKSEIEKDGLTREEWIRRNGCRADEDRRAALKTALELDIPFKVLDFSEEYNKRVVDYFYREYAAGRTPNPDVLCNSEIKFGLFLSWALTNGFDYVATGHYARIQRGSQSPHRLFSRPIIDSTSVESLSLFSIQNSADGGTVHFGSAKNLTKRDDELAPLCMEIPEDKHKDQTYFLWKLTQKELAHVLFPLGDLKKIEVRKIAKEAGLSVANRPDSQGICFVGNIPARKFLARRLKEKKGEVKNSEGEVIGTHKGIWFYTIGQRGGWDLTAEAQRKYMKKGITPIFYVISKDASKNELTVGVGKETERQKFEVGELNWMEKTSGELLVRIRHGGKLIPATLLENKVILKESQRGIAPGQSVVFYSSDGEMLGGGVIE